MTPDGSAYWSTVAQLCPILGVAVVIEARRFILNTAKFPRPLRAVQGIVLGGAALAIVQSMFQSLRALSSNPSDLFWAPFVTNLLVIVAAALISNPVLDAVWTSNADTLLALAFFLRHPVADVIARRMVRRSRASVAKSLVGILGNLESSEHQFLEAQAAARKAVMLTEAWAPLAAAPADELAPLLAAIPPPAPFTATTPAELGTEIADMERQTWGYLGRIAELLDRQWEALVEVAGYAEDVEQAAGKKAVILSAARDAAIADLRSRLTGVSE